MRLKTILCVIMLLYLYGLRSVYAEETDQFTLTPTELQDIGPIASYRLYQILEHVVAQTNSELKFYLANAAHSSHAAKELARRRTDTYLADLLYQNTGPGIPRWLRFHQLPKQNKPILYRERRPWKTVYWLVFSQSPLFVIGLAPTLNMYGYYFGTDKLGHFFMMGHTYYKIYTYLLRHGKSVEVAHNTIVTYGQILEQTYLGTLINGVYSNADLSANYAGWKFYMNLGHRIKIGTRTLSPILILKNNQWQISSNINPSNLLKPYLSDNLNEAWNPCRYSFSRGQISRQIKKRCPDWITRKGLNKQLVRNKLDESRKWHGETYGHWLPPRDALTLELCFE